MLKPFLEETASRFSVLNLSLSLALQSTKHHKYRSSINHLLLLIHAITIYVPCSGLIFSPERRVRRAREDRRNFTSWGLANLWTRVKLAFRLLPGVWNGYFRTALWQARRVHLPPKQQKQIDCFCVGALRGLDRWIWTGFFKRKCGNDLDRLAGNTIISIFHRLKYGLHVTFPQREHGGKKKGWIRQGRADGHQDRKTSPRLTTNDGQPWTKYS